MDLLQLKITFEANLLKMNLRTILSIALLISFFLPWINTPLFTLSAYEIPLSLQKANSVFSFFNDEEEMGNVIMILSIILYSIPILAGYRILKNISKLQPPKYVINEFDIVLVVTVFSFIVLKDFNQSALGFLGVGFYSSFFFSIIAILTSFAEKLGFKKGESIYSGSKNEPEVESNFTNKSDLINQLSQLQILKEKGVISDEVFEQQKAEILDKLNPINAQDSNTFQETNQGEHNTYEENVGTKDKWYEKSLFINFLLITIIIIIMFFVFSNKKMEQEAMTSETSNIEISDDELYNIELTLDDFYSKDATEFLRSYSYLDYGYIEGRISNFYENSEEDKRMIITITKMPTKYNYELNEHMKVGSEMEIMAESPVSRREIYDKIMVIGRKIRFCIDIQGSGGFTYLTYVKPLKE